MYLPFSLITNIGSWTLKDRVAGAGGNISDNRIDSLMILDRRWKGFRSRFRGDWVGLFGEAPAGGD
jgi:hypothetical protein